MADAEKPQTPYLVLARKYRPQSFESLIGQEAMVQTFANAFKTGRIHHAYILTGVRGVGKTTTARILARAFNYADESGAHPSLDLSKEGIHCQSIIEGSHVDVMEMDAASNTGIDNIREIIDSVKYGPVSAPYKVYIIDEVHMLSTQAFNGLLKTLEEPPPYVKFIFATTEIRKVPVTILSRCQRFDLRRITPETMTDYLEGLLDKEGITAEPDALSMIVRAGEGSVRDVLSLTDQAIAHGDGTITGTQVQAMLGLADKAASIDLFEQLMSGQIAEALTAVRNLYDSGADPETMIADLADLTHLVTRFKIVPVAADDASLTPDEKSRLPEMATKLGMRVLTRTWQILSKGMAEVANAANGLQAAEMVLVRLAYAADLPTPDELIEKLSNQPVSNAPAPQMQNRMPTNGGNGAQARLAEVPQASAPPVAQFAPQVEEQPMAQPQTYAELVALAREKRDLIVHHALESDMRPVNFTQGRVEVSLTETANPSIIATLSARLKTWTGRTWMVTVSNTEIAEPTLREKRDAERQDRFDAAHEDPLVQAVLETFPGARIVDVRLRDDIEDVGLPDPSEQEDED